MRLGRRPSEKCGPHLGRKQALEAGPRLLGPDEHHAGSADAANRAIECVRDLSQVSVDDRLDMALVPSLRPAALAMAAGNLRGLIGEGTQPTAAEPVDVPAFAPDVRDDGAVATADAPDERCEVELPAEASIVGDRPRQEQRPEQAVDFGGEDCDAADSLPLNSLSNQDAMRSMSPARAFRSPCESAARCSSACRSARASSDRVCEVRSPAVGTMLGSRPR